MYYFAILTSDYCKSAEMSMISLFKYNDITLHIFVVDSGYKEVLEYYRDKPYRDHLDIINIYDEEHYTKIFSYPHNPFLFDSYSAHLTLWMFRILDYIPEDVVYRIDLDILYLNGISLLGKYDNTMVGITETMNNRELIRKVVPNEHSTTFQINVGLCKMVKSKFNLSNSFEEEMIKRLDADAINYLIPEQDILNEITFDKYNYNDTIMVTNYNDVLDLDESKDILGFHFNGTYAKPWKLYDVTKLHTNNFNYVASIQLCYEVTKHIDFFRSTVLLNYKLTQNVYRNAKTPRQLKTVRIGSRMIERVKSWTS